jgi:hypothetical protein
MDQDEDQAPRHDNPADPVVGTPEEVAASGSGSAKLSGSATFSEPDEFDAADLTAKADTTKEASSEPSG